MDGVVPYAPALPGSSSWPPVAFDPSVPVRAPPVPLRSGAGGSWRALPCKTLERLNNDLGGELGAKDLEDFVLVIGLERGGHLQDLGDDLAARPMPAVVPSAFGTPGFRGVDRVAVWGVPSCPDRFSNFAGTV